MLASEMFNSKTSIDNWTLAPYATSRRSANRFVAEIRGAMRIEAMPSDLTIDLAGFWAAEVFARREKAVRENPLRECTVQVEDKIVGEVVKEIGCGFGKLVALKWQAKRATGTLADILAAGHAVGSVCPELHPEIAAQGDASRVCYEDYYYQTGTK